MTQTLKTLIPLSIVCTLLIGFSYTQSAWTEPLPGTVAATNTEPPINTGSAPQVKGGALGVDALAVYGDAAVDGNVIASTSVRSNQYCDKNGANCFGPSTVSGGGGLGVGQQWYNYTGARFNGVWYQNTTSKPIAVFIRAFPNAILYSWTSNGAVMIGGPDGSSGTWDNVYGVIPPGSYYWLSDAASILNWSELR